MTRVERYELLNNRTENIFSLIKNNDIRTILSVGCGIGEFEIKLALNDYDVTGLDIDNRNLEQFKKNIKDSFDDVNGVEPIVMQGNVMDLPFKDNSFDLVYGGGIIEHLKKPDIAVKNMLRVAKKSVILTTPYGFAHFDPDHKWFFIQSKDAEFLNYTWMSYAIPPSIFNCIRDVKVLFDKLDKKYRVRIKEVEWKDSTKLSKDLVIIIDKGEEKE